MRPERAAEPRSLRELQRLFQRLVAAPGPVAAARAALGVGRAPLAALFVGDALKSSEARLDVYAEAYLYRLIDVLRQQHEALAGVLGDDAFVAMVTRFLAEHPPQAHDIAEAGERLPGFLAGDAATFARPWLAELAQLERAHVRLFVASDAAPLELASLAGLAAEDLPAARLAPVPAFALYDCEYDVATLWADARDASGSLAAPPVRAATRLLVWRRHVSVRHRVVDDVEWSALVRIASGCSVAELGEGLAERLGVEAAAGALGELLARWSDEEILAARL